MNEILIIFLLMVLNGIFSMSEIALLSARKIRLKNDAERGDKQAEKALKLAENPDIFLSTVQVGITLIGILTGIYSGENLTKNLKSYVESYDLLRPHSQSIAFSILVLCITYTSLVIGELLPKRIGLTHPETIAKLMARPMSLLSKVAHPFIWLLSASTTMLSNVLNIKKGNDSFVTEEEIKAIINEGQEQGMIDEIEQEIIENVFNVSDRSIASLMTYRNDLVCLDINDTPEVYRKKIATETHQTYPVIDRNFDSLLGTISIKDLFLAKEGQFLHDFIKIPLYLPENNSAYMVLEKMKQEQVYHGFIVDEYGSLQGMVTLHDIMEAIVGEIPDANFSDYGVICREDGSYLADAQLPFVDFLDKINRSNEVSDFMDEDFTTLAGFVLHHLQHIPKAGDKFTWKDLTFEVIDMDSRRIDKVLVYST